MSRLRGLGCGTNCGCGPMGCNRMAGLGYMPATARDGYPSVDTNLGALLPGVGMMNDMLTEAKEYQRLYNGLDTRQESLQQAIIAATTTAENKKQGSLVNQLEHAMKKLQNLRINFRTSSTGLSNILQDLNALAANYSAGKVGIPQIVLATARLALIAPPVFALVKWVLNSWPAFEAQTLNLIAQAQGAQVKESPLAPLSQLPANLAQIVTFAALGVIAVMVVPRLLPKAR